VSWSASDDGPKRSTPKTAEIVVAESQSNRHRSTIALKKLAFREIIDDLSIHAWV